MYSDNKKKEYMRMFFADQPSDFCEYTINGLKLPSLIKTFLKERYAEGKSDKQIARQHSLSPDYVNKQINKGLVQSYDALKHWQYNAYTTPK